MSDSLVQILKVTSTPAPSLKKKKKKSSIHDYANFIFKTFKKLFHRKQEASCFHITLVFDFQTVCDVTNYSLETRFSTSTGEIYTFSNECENSLLVSNTARTSFNTVTFNCRNKKKTHIFNCRGT